MVSHDINTRLDVEIFINLSSLCYMRTASVSPWRWSSSAHLFKTHFLTSFSGCSDWQPAVLVNLEKFYFTES